MTAKDSQFGRKTFTSWLIESVGAVRLKRRKDYPEGEVDNTVVLDGLVEVYQFTSILLGMPTNGS
jgi:glycerol-3-phosphate O-acyltransferase/dihydroxyacetone phosphate acyltransferase